MLEIEARHLLGLADEIIISRPQSAKALSSWRGEVFDVISKPGPDSIEREARLEDLALQFRSIWMKIAFEHTGHHLKSPLKGDDVIFPLGQKSEMNYERIVMPTAIERRFKTYTPRTKGWAPAHLLFRSGMGAIVSLFQNLRPHFFSEDHEQIIVDFFGGYFETQRAFDLFSSPLITFRRHETGNDLLDAVDKGDGHVLFIEPVSYDWDMEVLDLKRLVASLNKRTRPPEMIVIDTTIVGHTFPMQSFLNALPDPAPPVVVQISSGLKLDQEGLELSNAGLFTLFCKDDSKAAETVQRFLKRLSGNRKINGTNLSSFEIAALDAPWFMNRKRFVEHSQAIFRNNEKLARALSPVVASVGGIFERVSHPSLSDAADLPWAVAPFVVFHFREAFDHDQTHVRITETLLKHSSRDGLSFFGTGMSFGFRSHRFEIIKPETILHPKGTAKGLLKVAMGSRNGPMASAVTELLTNLAKLKPGR